MPQQPVELILVRQWASYVSIPVWLMDRTGDLVYYNAAAGPLLGRDFEFSGPIKAADLASMFHTRRLDGSPLENSELPIVVAMTERRPRHSRFAFRGLDHEWRSIDVTAFPIERPGGELVGVVALFWESEAG